MPSLALLALSLSSLTISNSSSDVLNAQGSPASITILVEPTIQNTTDPSHTLGRVLDAIREDGRRRRAARTRQPEGQDPDPGISKGGGFGIFAAIIVAPPILMASCLACYFRGTLRREILGTTTPRTPINTQVDQEPADISTASGTTTPGTTTPRTTISSMTAETIGAAEIRI